jgi:hypothetical protein
VWLRRAPVAQYLGEGKMVGVGFAFVFSRGRGAPKLHTTLMPTHGARLLVRIAD